MKPTLQILHIEDSENDCELVKGMLKSNGLSCDVKRVETRPEVFDALQTGSYDLILSDCTLPNFSGLAALEIAHALRPEVPFIFVSGTIGEETAIESLRNGATDYVLKNHISKLAPAVRRAIAEAEERDLYHQMQLRLREMGRLEAISTLSHGIAHDFNNVLTIIMGHASLLSVEYDQPERVLENAATIAEAARRASDVVEQLFAFAHKSEGRGAPTRLNDWIEENLELIKDRLPESIDLRFEPTVELPPIVVDIHKLERIVMNLVANSIESMPKGGKITLSTEVVPDAEMPELLPKLSSGIYVCLKVTDTGSGMDAETREHVFEPFFTTKERGRGTGLGLPVVYGLMQSQNGYINVVSAPGNGTTLSLFFPVPKPYPTKVPPLPAGADYSLGGSETILVVEDEADVSFFLEAIFKKHGYGVLSAPNYTEALKLFEAHKNEIRLVFSDIGLPKVDGITVCSKLRQMKPGLPVLLASGYSPSEFRARMNEFGDEIFLAKPYRASDLLQRVRKVLNEAKAETPASQADV